MSYDKPWQSLTYYQFSSSHLINAIIHEHSFKKYPCFNLHTLSPDILLAPMASVPKAFSTHRLAQEGR